MELCDVVGSRLGWGGGDPLVWEVEDRGWVLQLRVLYCAGTCWALQGPVLVGGSGVSSLERLHTHR